MDISYTDSPPEVAAQPVHALDGILFVGDEMGFVTTRLDRARGEESYIVTSVNALDALPNVREYQTVRIRLPDGDPLLIELSIIVCDLATDLCVLAPVQQEDSVDLFETLMTTRTPLPIGQLRFKREMKAGPQNRRTRGDFIARGSAAVILRDGKGLTSITYEARRRWLTSPELRTDPGLLNLRQQIAQGSPILVNGAVVAITGAAEYATVLAATLPAWLAPANPID